MTIEPNLALSVRQPWAWAIFHGKDIENRTWRSDNPGLGFRGRVVIQAAQGMTRAEYVEAYEFMRAIGVTCPPAGALIRGAAIGTVEIVDVVERSTSPWFVGKYGFVLRAPELWTEPRGCGGALGFFDWRRGLGGEIAPPAKWMRPVEDHATPTEVKGLFGQPELPKQQAFTEADFNSWRLNRNAMHLNGGSAFFGHAHRCIDQPRLLVIDKFFRRTRSTERSYMVDGTTPCATLAEALAALSVPPRPNEEQLELLRTLSTEWRCPDRRGPLLPLADMGLIEWGRDIDNKVTCRLTAAGRTCLGAAP